MLNKANRLQKDKDFRKVFKAGKPVHFGKLAVRAASNNLDQIRFGFVLSNKIEKRATRRNALKRRLRAIARELISGAKAGYDVVVIIKEAYNFPFDYSELKSDFSGAIAKIGIIKNDR